MRTAALVFFHHLINSPFGFLFMGPLTEPQLFLVISRKLAVVCEQYQQASDSSGTAEVK